MLQAVFMMGSLGLVIGVVLAAASKVFYVYVDPLVEAVDDALPGANCGGCGLPGCAANAEAIVAGTAAPNSCVAGSDELADQIAQILGVSVEAKEPDIAKSGCTYSVDDAETKYLYSGINDCRAADLLFSGMKICNIGCLGLGSCVKACLFGALKIGENGLPVVDELLCTGCGSCEKACPKGIINLSSVTRRIIKEYTLNNCTTPCQRACPAGINIKDYIAHIADGNYTEAIQVIKERNPFPAIIGRICPRPCEDECRRKYIDEPVAINFLKRFAADHEKENQRIIPFKAPATNRKIAVIGGGIEGLSTAFFSARLGHSPVVYEASPFLGGLLRTAIAKNRLPSEILDWDIAGIIETGVIVETNKCLSKDITIPSLFKNGFQSVFLATGGWDSRLAKNEADKPNNAVSGIILLIDLLRSSKIKCGENVVISDSGKLSLDAVKACKQQGAKNITVIFREPEKSCSLNTDEISLITKEGASIIFGTGIIRILGKDDNITSIKCMDLTTDTTCNDINADTVIFSSGRIPELIFSLQKTDESKSSETKIETAPVLWEAIYPAKKPVDNEKPGFFAKNDTLSDFNAAIKAIAAGRRAAASIHQIMYGISIKHPDNVITQNCVIQNVYELENVNPTQRQIMPLSTFSEIDEGAEIEKGFTEDMAKKEADRCLKCGLVCYQQS